jgi:dTDP-4-amino-4,6-dideoxygalactose transaminase
MRTSFLPFALPDVDEAELHEITEAINSGWVTTGPKTKLFEERFAKAVGARHAVAVNSCTAALHLALEAIGLNRGDEVITTPYTFAATAEVIRYFDAVPVFVDVEARSLNIDSSEVEDAITPRTRAILPVHIGGLPAEMDTIHDIAGRHGLAVIEDAAHAFPTRYKGRLIGGLSTATCFSFYATKTITTGEGGMICTNDDKIAERCRIMSLHGISRDAWKRYTAEGNWYYEIVAPGFKYNMTDIASAMGLAQLDKVERMHRRRIWIAEQYNKAFEKYSQLELPADRADCTHAWHLYTIRLNLDQISISRDVFIEELKRRNIGVSVHFIPLHIHPYYQATYGYKPGDFPVAQKEYSRAISLPIYSRMKEDDVTDVIDAVRSILDTFVRSRT